MLPAVWRRISPPPRVINTGDLFGSAWTAMLRNGCALLDVDPSWALVVLAFDSGFDPLRESPNGARGLWQFMGTYYVSPTGEKVRRLYEEKDPVKQLADAFHFWTMQKRIYRVSKLPTRAHFFCLSLAPERLAGNTPAPMDTLLFPSSSKSYEMNKGLDREKKGYVLLSDLEWPLQKASQVYAQRLRRELEAAKAPIEEK